MLEDLIPPSRVTPCRVRTIMEELDKQDAQVLAFAITDEDLWPASTLAKELRKRDVVLSDNSITRHRKGLCSC